MQKRLIRSNFLCKNLLNVLGADEAMTLQLPGYSNYSMVYLVGIEPEVAGWILENFNNSKYGTMKKSVKVLEAKYFDFTSDSIAFDEDSQLLIGKELLEDVIESGKERLFLVLDGLNPTISTLYDCVENCAKKKVEESEATAHVKYLLMLRNEQPKTFKSEMFDEVKRITKLTRHISLGNTISAFLKLLETTGDISDCQAVKDGLISREIAEEYI